VSKVVDEPAEYRGNRMSRRETVNKFGLRFQVSPVCLSAREALQVEELSFTWNAIYCKEVAILPDRIRQVSENYLLLDSTLN
jgi:hypothetical protein